MTAVSTLATERALKDLKVFLSTLELFNPVKPTVYLLCDSKTAVAMAEANCYSGKIVYSTLLDTYSEHNRQTMEQTPGRLYKTLWEDFMMEKATVMEQAFNAGESRVFFFDSDICFMGPLPDMGEAKLGLCRHYIRPQDEARYGIYNAGFVYTADSTMPQAWREASKRSRYYDQAALEEVEQKYKGDAIRYLPVQNNYGWWRLFQGTESPQQLAGYWNLFRAPGTSGIRVLDAPLLSIHTHWDETRDAATRSFNMFVYATLSKLERHPPATALLKLLNREFPHLKNKS